MHACESAPFCAISRFDVNQPPPCSQVVLLDPQLPNLEELHLCGNRIASLEFDSSVGVEETSHGGSSHGCSGAARADSPAACTEPTGCHDSGGAARPQTPQQQQEAGSQHADCFAKLQVGFGFSRLFLVCGQPMPEQYICVM